MDGTIKTVLNALSNDKIRYLVEKVIDKHYDAFISQPAGCGNHHAYTGGLLVHSARVAHLGGQICDFYDGIYRINRDIVVAGGFLHDIGKVLCYKKKMKEDGTEEFHSTQMSRLHHHIPIGYGIIYAEVEKISASNPDMMLDSDALNRLLHIIVSHHGRLEYSSARLPKNEEAVLVCKADFIDAYLDADKESRGVFGR